LDTSNPTAKVPTDWIQYPLARSLGERLSDRVGKRELLDHDAAAGILEPAERRALQPDRAEIRRRRAIEKLRNRRQRRSRGVAWKSECVSSTRRVAHQHARRAVAFLQKPAIGQLPRTEDRVDVLIE
jgi:hypothetical protein